MSEELHDLIADAKAMISQREFDACEALLATAMFQNPHSAVPHNLMGLLLEKKRKHEDAMKHFRAANALDPTYGPSRWNLEGFSEFYKTRADAYFASDCDFERLPKPYERETKACI
jgi:tetratricopeptide (TPR) repeat protein